MFLVDVTCVRAFFFVSLWCCLSLGSYCYANYQLFVYYIWWIVVLGCVAMPLHMIFLLEAISDIHVHATYNHNIMIRLSSVTVFNSLLLNILIDSL